MDLQGKIYGAPSLTAIRRRHAYLETERSRLERAGAEMQIRLARANERVAKLLNDHRCGISIDPESLDRECRDMKSIALGSEDLERQMRLVAVELEELNRELSGRL